MITLILGVFHHFCKSARSASRQRENFMESLHSDGSATYLLIIWVEKIIPLGMKSKQKPSISLNCFSKYISLRLGTAESAFLAAQKPLTRYFQSEFQSEFKKKSVIGRE